MKFIRKHLAQSEFLRNIMSLLTGTLLAQLIPLLASPFLARMFSPAQFGEFALYMALVSPLAVIATGRYEMAIMLPKEEKEARDLVIASLLVSLLFSALLALLMCVAGNFLLAAIGHPELLANSRWPLLLPFSVFMISVYQVTNYWMNRKKAFKAAGVNKIVQTGSITTFSFVMGSFRVVPGLIWGDIAGRFLAAVYTIRQIYRCDFNWKGVEWGNIKKIARRYRDFPLFNSWAALLDTISLNIPVLIVSAGYTAQTTGYFNFTRQIIGVPLLMVSMTIAQVFYQRLSEKKLAGEALLPVFLNLAKTLFWIAVAYILVLLFAGESIFSFIFGAEWLLSGTYAKVLAFSFALKFIVSPLLISLPAVHAVKTDSLWKVCYFLSICILFFLVHLEFQRFLIIYTLIEVVLYLAGALVVYKVLHAFDRKAAG